MGGFWNLKDTKKCVEGSQLRKGDYLQEDRVELERNAGVRSISSTSEKEENDGKEYERLLERILERNNMNEAYRRVVINKGSHGVDGMKVEELLNYLKQNGKELKQAILEGRYKPSPVRRVEIPKPEGGSRLLGIPTVVDRVIQQSIAQILTPIFEEQFSENSYGFRPKRNAKQAVNKSKEYIEAGYTWVVDIDLAKYFDTVNHGKLMRILSDTIKDARVLSLIRKYLESGVMINGVVIETFEGTPQGGNLSPLLSNIMLNELDKELTKRGLKFCRYVDDCNIYAKSRKAANRIMKSITEFIEKKLKLKVNLEKSTVDRPWRLKFLGFSFYHKKGGIGVRVDQKPIQRLKLKLKKLTKRSRSIDIEQRMIKLEQLIVGWVNYFGIADMKGSAKALDEWLRRRIRMCIWKQWKKIKTRHDNLVKLGIDDDEAWMYANTRKGYWRISHSPILSRTFTNEYLRELGVPSILERYLIVH